MLMKAQDLLMSILPVSSDGHALVHAVSGARYDVVELVRHAARAGHVRHAAWAIQL